MGESLTERHFVMGEALPYPLTTPHRRRRAFVRPCARCSGKCEAALLCSIEWLHRQSLPFRTERQVLKEYATTTRLAYAAIDVYGAVSADPPAVRGDGETPSGFAMGATDETAISRTNCRRWCSLREPPTMTVSPTISAIGSLGPHGSREARDLEALPKVSDALRIVASIDASLGRVPAQAADHWHDFVGPARHVQARGRRSLVCRSAVAEADSRGHCRPRQQGGTCDLGDHGARWRISRACARPFTGGVCLRAQPDK